MNDSELIDSLGGPAKVAELLCMTKPGSVQRVSNWKRRGIPPRVKLDHPELIGARAAPKAVAAAQDAA